MDEESGGQVPYSVSAKQRNSFFRNFVRILSFSFIKAVWGIEEKLGYELETVLNSHFAINCIKEHPTLGQQPFYDPMSNAKVHRIYEATKLLRDFSLILLWFHDFVLPLHT